MAGTAAKPAPPPPGARLLARTIDPHTSNGCREKQSPSPSIQATIYLITQRRFSGPCCAVTGVGFVPQQTKAEVTGVASSRPDPHPPPPHCSLGGGRGGLRTSPHVPGVDHHLVLHGHVRYGPRPAGRTAGWPGGQNVRGDFRDLLSVIRQFNR